MSAQKSRTIKIHKFDKDNYNLWKMKMLLFNKDTHPMYSEILKINPLISQKEIP